MDSLKTKYIKIPLIPLRELVAFPSTIIPILVGREKSVSALKVSKEKYSEYIFLSVQTDQFNEDPLPEEIHKIGIIAKVEKSVLQRNGSFRVIIHGLQRGHIEKFIGKEDFYLVKVMPLVDKIDKNEEEYRSKSWRKEVVNIFSEYMEKKRFNIPGILSKLEKSDPNEISNIISSILSIPVNDKQYLLEELDVSKRMKRIMFILKKENLRGKSSAKDWKSKRPEDIQENDIEDYRNRIEGKNLPENVKESALKELQRFEMMPPYSAESTVSRTYLDWLLMIPWKKYKEENNELKVASAILDEDHYGLEKVKDRILDYIAVRQVLEKPSGEILCFIGPPGVGKSSLSKSIARALNRPFVRISLGGVKDEAEIRGHRRTYIGSYPGQIVKGLKKAKFMNPVFLLDEIDKLSSDFRGDPASALLEVLDPEQNVEFIDHYIDIEMDLSKIFFITTANTSENIPAALWDRMEIIEIPGYTRMEKMQIAKNFLIKKQLEKNGLSEKDVEIRDDFLMEIINGYTREAGVRDFERQLGKVFRKITRQFVENGGMKKRDKFILKNSHIKKFLGIQKFNDIKMLKRSETGVAIGMAWTPYGGELLIIESRFINGKGELILTGRLGEVMRESSSTAFSYIKLKLFELGFDTNTMEKYNVHLHIPQGAVPKDGPSAGVTLAISMISQLTGIKVKANFAMTGEITLRGEILPVGGIKEKIIAAHRYGVKNVVIPEENRKDYLEDIPSEIKDSISIYFVENMDMLIDIVLEKSIELDNIKSQVIKPDLSSKIQ